MTNDDDDQMTMTMEVMSMINHGRFYSGDTILSASNFPVNACVQRLICAEIQPSIFSDGKCFSGHFSVVLSVKEKKENILEREKSLS